MQLRIKINFFSYTLLLLVVLASCLQTGCFGANKSSRRTQNRASKMKTFDAVIVPGVAFKNGSWDSAMKARVIWSWILYKNGYTKNVIYSGGAVYSPFTEAIVMGLYARKLGIPKEHIFYDTMAKHSTENIYYSYLLAQKKGFKKIALATDPLQSFALRSFTRHRFTSPIYHIPFVRDSIKKYTYLNPEINPESARVSHFVSITKKQNFFQRFKGTIGKKIDWKQYAGKKLGPL